MNKVLSDERLGAKLRVAENQCVIFDSFTHIYMYIYYIYIYIYIYRGERVCVHMYLNPYTQKIDRMIIGYACREHCGVFN